MKAQHRPYLGHVGEPEPRDDAEFVREMRSHREPEQADAEPSDALDALLAASILGCAVAR